MQSHLGRIAKHTPKLSFTPPPLSIGTEINIAWHLYGKRVWHEWQHYPTVGLSLLHLDFGDPVHFGQAFAVYPTLNFFLFKKNLSETPLSINAQIGGGIAYLTRYYDAFSNPLNNAIGTALNGSFHFKCRASWQFSRQWAVQGGLSFTHFSNGSSRLPNYGINIPAVNLGLRWSPNPVDSRSGGFIHHDSARRQKRTWRIRTAIGMGLVSNMVPRGPKYPIYSASLAVVRQLNAVNRLSVGFLFEQNQAAAEFGLRAGSFSSLTEALQASQRKILFAEEEFLFGAFGIVLESGVYVQRGYFMDKTLYNRLGLRFYAPPIGKPKTRFHTGIYLKAHRVTAEQFSIQCGALF